MLLLRKEFLGFLQTCFPGKDVLVVAVVGAVVVVVVVAVVVAVSVVVDVFPSPRRI